MSILMRWQPDEVDRWCEAWASEKLKVLGFADLEPRDRLGRLASTLGRLREERDGASYGRAGQQFPEVYTGVALAVHRAVAKMPSKMRDVLSVHYLAREARVKAKAAHLDLSVPLYWQRLKAAKLYVESFVIGSTLPADAGDKVIYDTPKVGNFSV